MWRANRLADALAKLAAGRHRLPQWAAQKIGHAKQLALYSAAKLGVVTHRANHHKVLVTKEDGTVVTSTCRDSTAEKQQPRPPRKPPGTASLDLQASPAAAAAPQQALPRHTSRGTKRAATALHCDTAAPARKRQGLDRLHRLHGERQDEEQVAHWLAAWAARTKANPAGPTADERMEALRARVAARRVEPAEVDICCSRTGSRTPGQAAVPVAVR